MVDRSLLLRKLSELEEYLGQIREYSGLSVEAYAADWKTQRIVERTLHLMIELCVDVGNHIISDRKLRVPTSYADSFRVLAEAGLIGETLLPVMENMAKFRNILVHQYEKVDVAIMVNILKKHLDDFLSFRDAVLRIL